MHGREGGDNRKLIRHMWSVSSTTTTTTTTTTVADVIDSNGSSASFFYKDGRKINVGDCALFKPAEDSPPFVGLIRCLTSEKESNLKLLVSWLYRPAEVKLPRGVALEAALNEVFYSFHSDEIPAASLLHPCRVAFLRKGVELPPGVSSFVCRRVYDITNKCLWWLTDQDYIDERQEEVDKLLNKTCMEMRVSKEEHQGSRSPKLVNGAAATSPLKHSPDSVQNSSSNLSSHRKGKKRERGEHSVEAIKRERTLRPEDGDPGQLRSENFLNSEIAKFCEKGGLLDSEAVARLVRLMQPEKSAKKIDLAGRSMLVGIIAATDKLDCLDQFVQLKGLFVLNDWLQEAHKGKIGDSGNFRSSDKSVDDFLVVLLRALDKLPVNLNALRMCNIGKSVNQLRTHKNSDIQKKARSLVDAWKKRVEAEMNINDTKSVSTEAVPWPGRSQHDNSHGGNRHASGSDAAIRSSVTHHSSLKSAPVKLMPGESNSKFTSANPGSAKSALSPATATDKCDNYKDGQSRIAANGGSSDHQPVVREEKSSSSSQSHTNSQCSADQPKNMVSCGKEEIRRSTAVSRSVNKTVVNGSKHRKSANGPSTGVHRETASNRSSSMARHSIVEKESNNAVDASVQESSNHKLIVKIPNRGRGLAQSVTGGSLEDSSCRNCRASSPALSEKHDQSDSSLRGNKYDSHQISEVDELSNSVPQGACETRRFPTISKISCSPSSYEVKSRKAPDSSFSSMNALIESCARFSEANVPLSAGDDVGMNLLASVAASEISKSGNVSPAVSPQRNSKLAENSIGNHSGNRKQLPCDDALQENGQSNETADTDSHINVAGVSKVDVQCNTLCNTKTENLPQIAEVCFKNNGPSDTKIGSASPAVSPVCTIGPNVSHHGAESINKNVDAKEETKNEPLVESQGHSGCLDAENKGKAVSLNDDIEKNPLQDDAVCPSNDDGEKSNATQKLESDGSLEQNSVAVALQSDPMQKNEKLAIASCGIMEHVPAANSNDVKPEKIHVADVSDLAGLAGNETLDKESGSSFVPGKQGELRVRCADVCQDRGCKNIENKEAPAQLSCSSATQLSCSAEAFPETQLLSAAKMTKSAAVDEKNKVVSGSVMETVAPSPALGAPVADAKLGFDLNEGCVDEGKNGESVDLAACSDTVCSVSPLQIAGSSAFCSLAASVTVAAAAKGPFVAPDDLLWNKRELGWKGSAATSAFRPAEPRKVMEMPLGPNKPLLPEVPVLRPTRLPLDIDLNVADESSCQESDIRNDPVCEVMTPSLRNSGGFDLDLNKFDEAPDMTYVRQQMASNIQRVEVSAQNINSSSALNAFSNGAASGKRDFDLNDGPATEESFVEQLPSSQYSRGNIALQSSSGFRANSSDTRSSFSWYAPGTSYSVSVTPSALPDRESFSFVGIGGGPQRVMGGPNSALSFNPDSYRGSVLSSSPALPFHPPQFQYPVLPFGTSFPLSTPALGGGSSGFTDPAVSGRVPSVPSHLVGNAAAVSFQYPHAYVVSRSIPDVGNNSVIESNYKWGKQGLDLNSGPGVSDVEGREDSLQTVTRQVSTISAQSHAEDQARMYGMGGGHPKRKEPDGGWNMENLNFKQSSWR